MNDRLAQDPARDDELILVDGLDRPLGTASKKRAHCEGLLHRAFSVVLVREGPDDFELLLAQRSAEKYHSAGLWANSCCSHPRAGEKLVDAAYRRVREELGCEAFDLREIASFVYRAQFADGLCEYEYDHVLVGRCSGAPAPNRAEVEKLRWAGADEIAAELASQAELFAPWAYTVLSLSLAHIQGQHGVLGSG